MKKNIVSFVIFVSIVFAYAYWLGNMVGRRNKPQVEKNNYVSEESLTEWQVMQLAIIKSESEFDPLAVGKNEDWGILQITPIYVKEVNRILGEEKYTHEDAFNPKKSLEMFNVMQNHHNPQHDIDKAIASHNPTASSAYSIKVRKNMEWVRDYEEIRNNAK